MTHQAALLWIGLAVAFSGVTSAQAAPAPLASKTSSTYRCDSSASGECAILLYSSECTESDMKNQHPVLLCTHAFITEFSMKVGESRSVEGLPSNVKQCNAPPNVKPKFPDCAR